MMEGSSRGGDVDAQDTDDDIVKQEHSFDVLRNVSSMEVELVHENTGDHDEIREAWSRVFSATTGIIIEPPPAIGIEFGIDCMVYETGAHFRGLTHIPPGLHLIYYSHFTQPRLGTFLWISSGQQLLTLTWRKDSEEIHLNQVNDVYGMQRVLSGQLNENLAPYPVKQGNIWTNISSHISIATLERLRIPINSIIAPGDDDDETDADRDLTQFLANARAKFTGATKAITKTDDSGHCTAVYTDFAGLEEEMISGVQHTNNAVVTEMKLDKSWLVEAVIDRYKLSTQELLGEIEVCFVLFIMLYSYRALAQWRSIITILCHSEQFLIKNPTFAASFLKLMFLQLKFIPEDFFSQEVSKEHFLLPCFTALFSALQLEERCGSDIWEHRRRLKTFLEKKFNIKVIKVTTELGEDSMEDSICIIENDMAAALESDGTVRYGWNTYNEDVSLMPVSEREQQDASDLTFTPPKVVSDAPLSRREREDMMYSWRYPLLYEEMVKQSGREDMLMTAVRILEELDDKLSLAVNMVENSNSVQREVMITRDEEMRKVEALKFIENEGPRLC